MMAAEKTSLFKLILCLSLFFSLCTGILIVDTARAAAHQGPSPNRSRICWEGSR
jgi:hypothetical protein